MKTNKLLFAVLLTDKRHLKAFSLISSRDHCQRSSLSQMPHTPRAEYKAAKKLNSGLVE